MTHRVRTVHDKPLEQDAGDLLLHHLRLRFGEEVQQDATKVVRVLVGVAELVGHRIEEEVPPLGVELVRQLLETTDAQTRPLKKVLLHYIRSQHSEYTKPLWSSHVSQKKINKVAPRTWSITRTHTISSTEKIHTRDQRTRGSRRRLPASRHRQRAHTPPRKEYDIEKNSGVARGDTANVKTRNVTPIHAHFVPRAPKYARN